MILDVTGFGWSGSGAVHDFLREYDDVQFASFDYDFEFNLLWWCDGIADLEHKLSEKHCRFFDSDKAIKRFIALTEAMNRVPMMQYNRVFKGQFPAICQKYVYDLVDLFFEGHSFDNDMFPSSKDYFINFYNKIIRKLLGNHYVKNTIGKDLAKGVLLNNKHSLFLSYNPDSFLERTHLLFNELFSYLRKDSTIPLVTDQFFPTEYPERYFKYVGEPTKCIVVRRDPRDIYLLSKVTYNGGIQYPVNSVDDFIIYYKTIVENTKKHNNPNVLFLNFEDMIYDYDNVKLKIENFAGIKQHARKREIFNPLISLNNTQLFKKYTGYENDIRKIEEQLSASLFCFESFPNIKPNFNIESF